MNDPSGQRVRNVKKVPQLFQLLSLNTFPKVHTIHFHNVRDFVAFSWLNSTRVNELNP